MTQLFDITTFSLFQRGEVKGREEGREEGVVKTQLVVIANMLTKSNLTIEQIADLTEAEESFVLFVKEKLENDSWAHPDSWSEEEWVLYFEKKQENT